MTKIEEAQNFIIEKVIDPALNSELPTKLKNNAKHVKSWLNHFKRIGDLIVYMDRFKAENNDPIYIEFKKYGLLTFEDIAEDFKITYGAWADDKTTLDDFIIGSQYTAYDILILVKSYDTRSGGMFVVGNNNAVVIKATLSGGDYSNEWLEANQSLKYYLKSIKGEFGEHFKANAAIIKNPTIPIYTFVRQNQGDQFTFEGIFNYASIDSAQDGSKWFVLNKRDNVAQEIYQQSYVDEQYKKGITKSQKDSTEARQKRLKNAPKKPKQIIVFSVSFVRNTDVVAEVLKRANGICEQCKQSAPFISKATGKPYLEVHHKIQLANGGDDTVENSLALCPNCHRQLHFG
jgi:5-methylcytosine-specific restriction protein A